MRAVEPSFEIPEDLMDVRESLVRSLWRADDPDVVDEFRQCRLGVAFPAIRADATPRFDVACQERSKTVFAGVRDECQPQPPCSFTALAFLILVNEDLNTAHHQALVPSPASSLAFLRPADERLVGFDKSFELSSGITHHGLAKAVEQVPRCRVTGDSELPLQLMGADPRRVSSHKIGGPKPFLKRQMRVSFFRECVTS